MTKDIILLYDSKEKLLKFYKDESTYDKDWFEFDLDVSQDEISLCVNFCFSDDRYCRNSIFILNLS